MQGADVCDAARIGNVWLPLLSLLLLLLAVVVVAVVVAAENWGRPGNVIHGGVGILLWAMERYRSRYLVIW